MDKLNDHAWALPNAYDIPVRILANDAVRIEQPAVQELQAFLDLQNTVDAMREADPDIFGAARPALMQVAVTPDFHKGAGVPIGTVALTRGFVAPQAIGRDINCGMRMLVTEWTGDDIRRELPRISSQLRHVFFEGGRALPLDRVQKEAMLRQGLTGVLETAQRRGDQDLWRYYRPAEQEADLARVTDAGSLDTPGVFEGLRNYLDHAHLSYDGQLGSIGGGNHFVELQEVRQVLDGPTAHAWNLKPGTVVAMVHTGSVSVGYPASGFIRDLMLRLYPRSLRHPANGLFAMPTTGPHAGLWEAFRMALHNAANFAFANRLFLGLMLHKVLAETLGDRASSLLYDSGHNMLREVEVDGAPAWLHRKGAAPARGPAAMQGTPFGWTGEPVLIPGSMGASSYIMAGNAGQEHLWSASHGAGRSQSRGKAMRVEDAVFERFMERFHIVTPIDPRSPALRGRQDILRKWADDIKQEAPWAFKDIGPVIDTQVTAGNVRPVARTEPILTVKG